MKGELEGWDWLIVTVLIAFLVALIVSSMLYYIPIDYSSSAISEVTQGQWECQEWEYIITDQLFEKGYIFYNDAMNLTKEAVCLYWKEAQGSFQCTAWVIDWLSAGFRVNKTSSRVVKNHTEVGTCLKEVWTK